MHNSLLIFPIILYIKNKKVYSLINNNYPSNLMEDLSLFENKPIKSINGIPPFEYIQNFNDRFLKFKSPQAQFVFNLIEINNPFSLANLPLDYSNLTNIKIVYDDDISKTFDYRVEFRSNLALKIYYFLHKFEHFFYEDLNIFDFEWDLTLEDGKIKCLVDNENKVNVIYQNSFLVSDLEEGEKFFDQCFSNFDNNNYPIIIIESFNSGGYGSLADYLISYINLNKTSTVYESYRYNEEIEKYVAPLYSVKTIQTCEYENYTYLFNSSYIEDNYGFNSNGEKIKHKRTKIFDSSEVNENFFYSVRKKAKHIRKPNEIIIYTDGYSYSATSDLIKRTQLKGGAIIVGYDGNPFLNTFDASQSPSAVQHTFSKYSKEMEDSLSLEIESLGFSLTYTIAESFPELDNENENKSNIPLEYQIHEIDERVNIFNGYDDSKYQNFIDEAKKIFKKYETKCNPKNKNLLLIDEKCNFLGPHLHGGFPCDENGYWNKKLCVPSYCDVGYVYDKKKNKCIKDVCFKKKEFNKFYYNRDDDEIENVSNLTKIFIGLFVIFQIIFLIIMFTKAFKKNKKIFIIIILALEFVLIIVSHILYHFELKEII